MSHPEQQHIQSYPNATIPQVDISRPSCFAITFRGASVTAHLWRYVAL